MPAGEDNRTRSAGFAYDAERQSIRQTGEQTRTRSIYPPVLPSATTMNGTTYVGRIADADAETDRLSQKKQKLCERQRKTPMNSYRLNERPSASSGSVPLPMPGRIVHGSKTIDVSHKGLPQLRFERSMPRKQPKPTPNSRIAPTKKIDRLHCCKRSILKWYHRESNQGHKDFQQLINSLSVANNHCFILRIK